MSIDLISNARARVALPSAAANPSADDTAINYLITACSRAIMRHCKRSFVTDSYDELYNGRAQRQLFLRNYPLQSVKSVRYRPVTVLKITNTLANTPQARVEVLSTGLRLTRVTSGVTTTVTAGLDFAGNVTLTALQAAVNAVGSGWSASSQGYDSWPSADLYCPNGSTSDPGNLAGQGALQCVSGSFAELKMHTYELQGFQINARQGGLLRAIPYTDPELLHPEDLIFPIGVNNFRVQYTAGYATIPEDLQEACAQLVAYHFRLGPRENPNITLPPIVEQYLAPYVDRKLFMPGG
jgi:hypothetical protein